jgi:hypothetical protein
MYVSEYENLPFRPSVSPLPSFAGAELEFFAAGLRDVTLSLTKKRFWTVLREAMAAHGGHSAARGALLRAAADEVAHLTEPSPRIELNGHSASSLLRALAEAGNVDPSAFDGVRGRGQDDSVVHIFPFDPAYGLFAFARKKKDEAATFVYGYLNFTGHRFVEFLGLRHGRDSVSFQRMSAFVSHAQAAPPEPSLPRFSDAILARLR